jgi:uncharacterized RDD family membrane protein YckC
MRAWKIQLVKADGDPCKPSQALVHLWLGTALCSLFGIGWIYQLFDREQRALQDVVCGTRVIRVHQEKGRRERPPRSDN